MDKIVAAIQNLSGSDADLKTLKTLLQKEEGLIVKNMGVLDEVLSVLDPVQNSLGFAYILAIKSVAPKLDAGRFLNTAVRFLLNCNGPQIRMVPSKFSQVCRRYAQISIEANQALRAIKPLRTALNRLRLNSETLTPVHADYIQVCLVAKFYSAALPVLEEEIFDVNPDSTSTTPKDLLLYSYYGGMVYTGLKEYKKALTFFRTAISAPAIVLSAIMVESYKKFVLLSLLVHGKVQPLPRYASSIIQRHSKTSFPQYTEFANAFSTNSSDEVHKAAQAHLEAFAKDKNFGLVKQCIQSLNSRNIQRLTQTYITLSLQDIASSVKLKSPQEAEQFITRMVEKGEIFATINQKDGMVSFHENPESYDTTNMLQALDRQIQTAIDLGKKVRTSEESISSSPHYLQKTAIHERVGRGSGWGEMEEFMEGSDKGAMMGGPMGVPGKNLM